MRVWVEHDYKFSTYELDPFQTLYNKGNRSYSALLLVEWSWSRVCQILVLPYLQSRNMSWIGIDQQW